MKKMMVESAVSPASLNPGLSYFENILFAGDIDEIKVGGVSYDNYEKLVSKYLDGNIHPRVLKEALVDGLDRLIKPVRDHFENNVHAKDLYEKVCRYRQTK